MWNRYMAFDDSHGIMVFLRYAVTVVPKQYYTWSWQDSVNAFGKRRAARELAE